MDSGTVNNVQIHSPTNRGFLLALVFFISPALYLVLNLLSSLNNWSETNPSFLFWGGVGITGLIVIIWASGIVNAVSEIGRFASKTAEVGLFILLVTPFAWVIIGVISVAAMVASFMEQFNALTALAG